MDSTDTSTSLSTREPSPLQPGRPPLSAQGDGSRGVTDPWWLLRSVPVRLLVMFVALLAVDILCQLAARALQPRSAGALSSTLVIGVAIATIAVMIAAYRFLVTWIEKRPAVELGRERTARRWLVGALCGLGLFAIVELLLMWKGVAHLGQYTGTHYLLAAFFTAVATGVAEEIVFRGVVFRVLEEGFGTLVGLLFSAALFGALHGFNPGASLVSSTAIAVEAGVLLAAAYTATRSLWLPIGLHFGWNFAEGGLFGAAVSGNTVHGLVSSTPSGDPLWSGGAFGPEASIVAVGVCALAAAVFLIITVRRGHWVPMRFRMRMPRSQKVAEGMRAV